MGLRERFAAYDELNPHVWQGFCDEAHKMVREGYRILSGQMVMERLRYDTAVRGDGERWKVNNSYVAFYARRWNEAFPELPQCKTRIQKV